MPAPITGSKNPRLHPWYEIVTSGSMYIFRYTKSSRYTKVLELPVYNRYKDYITGLYHFRLASHF